MLRRLCRLLHVVAVGVLASGARATPTDVAFQPHTIAELELGLIALPNAPISIANQGGATPFGRIGRGDATLQTGIHVIYRGGADWAVGAGALFSPLPTSNSDYRNALGLQRTHARSYLFIGAEVRHFLYHSPLFEVWMGFSVGGVLVADRFSTNGTPVPAILGTRDVTVSTEGFGFGIQVGTTYALSDTWVLGLALRANRWFLPNAPGDPTRDPECSSIGDCPTLSGPVEAFELGFTLGYRMPL